MHGSLLVDIAVILGAAFPMLFLRRWLRLPEVICYLVTGVLIGPHALGIIRDTAAVEAIAEIGVAMILFFIGLHVPVERLRALGRTMLVSGSLQMGLTVFIVAVTAWLLGVSTNRGVFFGLMIALGSTAVVLPILSSRDEMGAPFARRFLAVSLFQDFAVIPLIMLVPALATGGDAPPLGRVVLRVLIALGAVIALVAVARIVVPWLFKAIARLGSREAFTAAAIVLILATIAIAERIGISAALGAFAAGVVIGDTEFIHDIGGVLRPFRDALSALFFASIGMLLQPAYVVTSLPIVLGTVLFAIAAKVIAAYPAFRAGGALPRTSMRAAFAIAPIGEFSFLLALEGKRHGILRAPDEQLFLAVAVVTLSVTPLLVRFGNSVAERLHQAHDDTDSEPREQQWSRHIVIIGYGLNGQNVARVLTATGVRHVVVEEDPYAAELARKQGSPVIIADASDVEALDEVGLGRALAAVIAISDQDGTRRIVQACRRLAPELHILVRTRYVSEVERLRTLGANEVIPEEFETSIEIVTRLLRVLCVPGNLVAAQLRILRDEGYKMLRDPGLRAAEGRRLSAVLAAGTSQTYLVLPDSRADGQSLDGLAVADDRVAVPALLRDAKPLSPVPLDLPLQAGDTLFLVGAHEDLVRVVDRLEQPREPSG